MGGAYIAAQGKTKSRGMKTKKRRNQTDTLDVASIQFKKNKTIKLNKEKIKINKCIYIYNKNYITARINKTYLRKNENRHHNISRAHFTT